ncbi:mannan endo-1,4-beta-mannosidase [Paenibacillus algorifonticola]|uniref:Mannan endo-1,4-beta-mannosidase n=1 Tax=Paenibacillus algorifonticola TaxID=684063 RepID=A0A1I2I1N2_9BACL|nr:glycosyl hydrolase [Paenibacillus algorifonticola]SFF35563.1 mannan endo-1,4-beta-mannosidase [Paenibacillus algorifonticola]
MNKKRKWIAAVMAPAMVVTMFSSAAFAQSGATAGSNVSDIQGHWAKAAIEKWSAQNIVSGYPNGSFHPNGSMTRAEFVAVINRVFGFATLSASSFSDVPKTAWYVDELRKAQAAGYYDGFPNNEARAEQPITRQDAVTLLARVFELKAADHATFAGSFKDSGQISSYAQQAINALQGIISGYENGAFRPAGKISRAEVITLVDKLVAEWYANAGNYTAAQAISGHAIINHTGITLKDAQIAGNLYLTAGIGDGEAAVNRASVKGTTFIAGGGEHTVIFNDSKLANVEINRKDGKVHVEADGETTIDSIMSDSPAILELGDNAEVDSIVLNQPTELITGPRTTIGQLTVQADSVIINGKAAARGTYTLKNGTLAPISTSTTPGTGTSSGGSGSSGGNNGGDNGGSTEQAVNFVDQHATAETKSLFAYLNGVRGQEILFGHQHATDEGVTLTRADGSQSEVKNSVGDFPAVFGWDTLSLEGKEKPGVPNNIEQSRINLTAAVKNAHNLGGIVTLSTHFPNFVTGGSFNDTSGNVVAHILPGGNKHAEFNAFLDTIANFANNVKDDDGKLIPILFRPFHEQNGGWFWWGAKTTTTSEYKEIFRYTVEYLRDKKDVRNFLYVFSPNGSFGGAESTYLTTYPGDDYVDVLGMDQYDNKENAGSQGFLNGLVTDLGMISRMADSKGKIATFSEFGYSPEGMKTTGNNNTTWFTDLLNAIKSDEDASRIAYMQTWANFGLGNNLYVPYKNAPNGLGDHELLPDFINFYNDSFTTFRNEVQGVYGHTVVTAPEQPFMHIATPTDNSIVGGSVTIRARALEIAPTKVVYTVQGSDTEYPMALDSGGFFYTANWSPAAGLNGKTAVLNVKVYVGNQVVLTQTTTVSVQASEILMKTYSFDQDTEGVVKNGDPGTYPETMALTVQHDTFDGNGVLKLDAQHAAAADLWQEFKLALPALDGGNALADVKRIKLDAFIPLNAGVADATISSIAMLAPDWDTKYGMSTTKIKLSELPQVTVGGTVYAKFTPVIDLNDAEKSTAATGLAISFVGSGLAGDFPIYVDQLSLYSTYAEAEKDPAVVDNFETYQGSDAALAAKFIHAGGDATAVALDGAHKSSGNYAMKLDYTLGTSGYAGITKVLGGVDWSTLNNLKFWMVPDGSNQKLVIQLRVDGVSYEAYPSLAGTAGQWVSLHFNEFTVAPWDTGNTGKKINKVSLKNVQEFSVYVNAVNGATLNSTLYFDDIEAIDDGTGGVPNGGSGSGSSPAESGTLYGFEADTAGWVVSSNEAQATDAAITADEKTEGDYSLTSTFSLASPAGFELTKVAAADLSAATALSVKVKLSQGTANARLYIKTGSTWDWHDSGTGVVDSSGFKTLTLPLSSLTGLDSVQAIGVKIEPAAGQTGTASVYVDDVYVDGGDSGSAGVGYDFEAAEEGWAINTDGGNAYNTANARDMTVSSDEASAGSSSLKAAFDLNGGDFQLRRVGELDLGTANTLSAKFKVVADGNATLAGAVSVKLFLQTGGGWSWFASNETVSYSGDGFVTVSYDLSGVADKNNVQALGIQVFAPSGSTGTATIYLDEVKVQ